MTTRYYLTIPEGHARALMAAALRSKTKQFIGYNCNKIGNDFIRLTFQSEEDRATFWVNTNYVLMELWSEEDEVSTYAGTDG